MTEAQKALYQQTLDALAAPSGIVFAPKFLNDQPFEHRCHWGTRFMCLRCDFSVAVFHYNLYGNDLPKDRLMLDVAEMVGFHAGNIHPRLNGFQGYDTLRFVEVADDAT